MTQKSHKFPWLNNSMYNERTVSQFQIHNTGLCLIFFSSTANFFFFKHFHFILCVLLYDLNAFRLLERKNFEHHYDNGIDIFSHFSFLSQFLFISSQSPISHFSIKFYNWDFSFCRFFFILSTLRIIQTIYTFFIFSLHLLLVSSFSFVTFVKKRRPLNPESIASYRLFI